MRLQKRKTVEATADTSSTTAKSTCTCSQTAVGQSTARNISRRLTAASARLRLACITALPNWRKRLKLTRIGTRLRMLARMLTPRKTLPQNSHFGNHYQGIGCGVTLLVYRDLGNRASGELAIDGAPGSLTTGLSGLPSMSA